MSKWDKLNKKFDDVLGSMTKTDWAKWDSERDNNSIVRRRELLSKSVSQQCIVTTTQIIQESFNYFVPDGRQLYYDDETQKYNYNKKTNPENSRGYLFYVNSQYEQQYTKGII